MGEYITEKLHKNEVYTKTTKIRNLHVYENHQYFKLLQAKIILKKNKIYFVYF